MYVFMGYWAGVVEIFIDGPDLGGGEFASFIRAGPAHMPEAWPRHGTTPGPGWPKPN